MRAPRRCAGPRVGARGRGRTRRVRAESVDRRESLIGERTVFVAVARRLGSGDVELGRDKIARAVRGLQQSAADVDVARHDRDGARPVGRRWLATIDFGHERRPRWRGEHASLCIALDRLPD